MQSICNFYMKGACRNGPNCRFLHVATQSSNDDNQSTISQKKFPRSPLASQQHAHAQSANRESRFKTMSHVDNVEQPVCKYFQTDTCKFGDQCKNAHVLLGGPATSQQVHLGPSSAGQRANAEAKQVQKQMNPFSNILSSAQSKSAVFSLNGGPPNPESSKQVHAPSIDVQSISTAIEQAMRSFEISMDECLSRRAVARGHKATAEVSAEQQVLREEIEERQKMLAVFQKTIRALRDRIQHDHSAADAIQREIRRLVPPGGKCLPFYAFRNELVDMICKNQVCIVIGQTGSGKSTQMIQYVAEAGFGTEGQIVCCQPRKLAATSLAARVSEEWSGSKDRVGQEVGYKVGGATSQGRAGVTRMKFVTSRVLLNEILEDPELRAYSVVIVDEAHERSIDTDILLGMLAKTLAARRRTAFRLVITSATIDDKLMSEYFGGCPVMKIPGRTYPVEVKYQEQDENFVETAWQKAAEIHRASRAGDGHILVFLTGQEDIDLAIVRFKAAVKGDDVLVYPLHGKLPPEETDKVFQPAPDGVRKVIFATNQAETSITIDKVRYVVDSGMAKVARYDAARGMQVLSTELINRSSAQQRKGRAGRTGPGICYRLYSEEDFDNMMESETAEILRSHLGMCILQLKQLGVHDVERFNFVERPPAAAMDRAMEALRLLGCLAADGSLTERGRHTAQLEMEPMLCRMVLEGCRLGVGEDCLSIAALVSVGGNVFYRGGTKEQKGAADQVKASQCHAGGDFCTLLEVFKSWEAEAGPKSGKLREEQRKWCVDHYANGKTLSAAYKARAELRTKIDRLNVPCAGPKMGSDRGALLRRAIAEGYFMNLALSNGPPKAGYFAASLGQSCALHPASSMVVMQEAPRYVVFQELAQTTRLFLRGVTEVDPAWLHEISPSFMQGLRLGDWEEYQLFTLHGVSRSVGALVVGKRGVTITGLEAELGCIIEPIPEEYKIRVWARRSKLQATRARMEELLQGLIAKIAKEASEVPVAGRTRLVVGAGGLGVELLFASEFTRLFLSNVRGWDEMLKRLREGPAGGYAEERCAGATSDGSAQWGTVRFVNKEQAAVARRDLDGRMQADLAMTARACQAQATGVQMCRDTSLRISWPTGVPTGNATVFFASGEQARAAKQSLHYMRVQGRVVECEINPAAQAIVYMDVAYNPSKVGLMVGPKGSNLQRIQRDSKILEIKITRETPGKIGFRGELHAVQQALMMVLQVDPNAQGHLCSPEEVEMAVGGNAGKGKSGLGAIESLWSLRLSGLPLDVYDDELTKVLADYKISGVVSLTVKTAPPPPESEQTGETAMVLRSMMSAAAEGLGELEDLQLIPPSDGAGRAKAFANFSTPGCVAKAVDMFHNQPCRDYGLGPGRLQVRPNLAVSIAVPQGLAQALAADLRRAIAAIQEGSTGRGQLKASLVDKGSKGVTVTINGESDASVTRARIVLDQVLAGHLFSCGDDPAAVSRLCNQRGCKEMERICAQVPGAYIMWDRRVNQIRLFGKDGPRNAAEAALRAYAERAGRDESWVRRLPRGGVRALVGWDGLNLDRILKKSDCREVTLNVLAQTLTCVGTPEALEKAKELVGTALSQISAPGNVGGGVEGPRISSDESTVDMTCGLCLCEVEEGEASADLVCGHRFHRECLKGQMANHATPAGMPLPARCSAIGCGRLLPLRDLLAVCGTDTWSAICRRSFRAFVSERASELQACPTPDCPQVMLRAHPGLWQCDCCLKRYCVPCTVKLERAVEAHNELSCNEYRQSSAKMANAASAEVAMQEFLADELASGDIRKCPNCSLPQSKDNRCNHVTCSRCKRHWCWACSDFHASEGGPVYMHQSSCKGFRPQARI